MPDGAPPFTLRIASAADIPFMRKMLYEAATIAQVLRNQPRPLFEEVLGHPSNRRYVEGWGRAGDCGVIAEDASGPIGAAWFRLFTPEDRGDGMVAWPGAPEIAIGVRDDRRNVGAGAALLRDLQRLAREDGYTRLVLSVDPLNPARRLYARCGYTEVDADPAHAGTSTIMEWRA
jgi:GNAT superfamily N-acetyltransferase